jgi:general secretion pathway protein D
VLIEAKIVEVSLNEEFRSGIDWGSISLSKGLNFGFDIVGGDSSPAVKLSARNKNNGSLEAAIGLTEKFGTARTLSSPRITAINNQQAALTFAQNKVYFQIKVDRETNSTTSNSQQLFTVDSTVKTVPIGIIVTVQPSINPDTEEITLNVRPTLSRMVDEVEDPAVAYLASQSSGALPDNLKNLIPVVEVREMDTIMKIKSGDIMVMGGMMEEKNANTDTGVPWISGVPWIGNAFKDVDRTNEVVEMVIFMKATIIPSSGKVSKKDIQTYKKFTNDPHPLNF